MAEVASTTLLLSQGAYKHTSGENEGGARSGSIVANPAPSPSPSMFSNLLNLRKLHLELAPVFILTTSYDHSPPTKRLHLLSFHLVKKRPRYRLSLKVFDATRCGGIVFAFRACPK